MALRRGTTFGGLSQSDFGVGRIARVRITQAVADDQGYCWEAMTNTSALDGTSASTVAGHTHQEEGNLQYVLLASNHFGTDGAVEASWNSAVNVDQAPLTLATNTGSSASNDFEVLYQLLYVPKGFENRDIIALLDCAGDPRLEMTLYNSSLTAVASYTKVPVAPAVSFPGNIESMVSELAPQDTYAAQFQVTASGLWVLGFKTNIVARVELRQIRALNVLAVFDPLTVGAIADAPPAVTGAANVVVGDSDNSNAWHAVDDNLVSTDNALHALTTVVLGGNAALLWEKALGLPAGNAALTAIPHDHDGSGQQGPELDAVLWAKAFGGAGSSATVYGRNATAPQTFTTTFARVVTANIYLAKSANVTGGAGGTSKLKVAVLMYHEAAKTGAARLRVTLGADTRNFDGTAAAGLQLLTTTVEGYQKFAFTSDALNGLVMDFKQQTGGTGSPRLYSAVLYREV